MEKLLVVDGSNLLFQMFYGMPARIVDRHGKPIQGTLGFVGALLRIIRMTAPTHIVVLFDGACQNIRKELDSAYKANRPDYSQMSEEETPFSQLSDIFNALDFLQIRYSVTTECEADDWIAGYALQYGEKWDVVIASFDSDFFQLISDHVQILRYRGDCTVIWDKAHLWDKLHVLPEQYAMFKALTGDAADNIRGADKVGSKTAAALLAQFGDLETMLQNVQHIQKPSIRESVIRNEERLRLNYLLIRLQGGSQLPFLAEQLRYTDLGVTSTQVLQAIGVR